MIDTDNAARAIFEKHGGMLRTRQALDLGIHPRTLYHLRDTGELIQVSRGVFRLSSAPPLGNPDLVTIATRVPDAVVCLISALAYHEITTEIPHEVYIALSRGTRTPIIDHPPIRVFRFSGPALTEGIQRTKIDGIEVKVYGAEKSVVDAFRFRNKIGLDVAIEALRFCIRLKGVQPSTILHYARLCRQERVMRPYLEALL